MRARPRIKSYKKSKAKRCVKCHKLIRRHQKRCKSCSLDLSHLPL